MSTKSNPKHKIDHKLFSTVTGNIAFFKENILMFARSKSVRICGSYETNSGNMFLPVIFFFQINKLSTKKPFQKQKLWPLSDQNRFTFAKVIKKIVEMRFDRYHNFCFRINQILRVEQGVHNVFRGSFDIIKTMTKRKNEKCRFLRI